MRFVPFGTWIYDSEISPFWIPRCRGALAAPEEKHLFVKVPGDLGTRLMGEERRRNSFKIKHGFSLAALWAFQNKKRGKIERERERVVKSALHSDVRSLIKCKAQVYVH